MVQDQLQQKIVCPGVVTCLNASPDGLFLAAAVAEGIYLWEVSHFLNMSAEYKWCSVSESRFSVILSQLPGYLTPSNEPACRFIPNNSSSSWSLQTAWRAVLFRNETMVMIDRELFRVYIWPVTSHRLTTLTYFISFHGHILSVVTGFYFILVISNSHVCSGVWFQPFDWFRCLQVDCCLCSAVTIRTSPAWSSQTTAAILFLEEKTTWLWCGICPGGSRLNTPELCIVVVDVCASVWFRWI